MLVVGWLADMAKRAHKRWNAQDTCIIDGLSGIRLHHVCGISLCAYLRCNWQKGNNRMQRKNEWYVIQVPTGKEEAMCRLIERAGSDALTECFTPQYATQKKVRGMWRSVDAVLFPGYVIAVTDNADALNQRLSRVVEYTRMLTMGERFTPLEDSDRVWLSAYTSSGNRVIPMSIAEVDEGDCVRVLSGPLMGHEGWIRSVNRRKSLAFIEVEMFGRKIQTRIGLGIVRKHTSRNNGMAQSKMQSCSRMPRSEELSNR